MAGVTVTLRHPGGAVESKVTGADGYANWTELPIGTYRVTETVPPGWLATLPAAVDVTVTFNTTVDVTFANRRVGNLHAYVYEDANGNGQQDAGEGPIPSIAVTIRFPDGSTEVRYTNASGDINWTDIPVGAYRVTETVPPGWVATRPTVVDTTVIFNATTEVVYALRRVGNLRVLKYEDANGNGQRDAGEGPVAGVTVTIRHPGGAVESKITGADGYANWTELPIGTYRVTETVPPGWLATLPAAVDVAVTFNTTVDVTFGNRRVGNLHAYVYEDANGNGQQDAGEGPIPSIAVTIRFPDGSTEVRHTNASGDVNWTDIPVGAYRVTETVPPGWVATRPTVVDTTVIFNATTEVVYALRRVGNLRVLKYEDANGNGQRDAGEGPVAGVTVTIRHPGGAVESKVTGADGYANWTELPIGTYRVTETVPPGWLATLPAAVDVAVTFNTTVDVTFGNRRVGNLHAYVYEDANGNGQQDAGEGPIPSIAVTIRFPDGSTEVRYTNASGDINWTDIPVGAYRVTETVPPGWVATRPTVVDTTVIFNATTEVVYALRRVGNLRVFKYEDANGNGQRDAGEGPVAGVTVTIRHPGGAVESKVTGADGYANWTELPIGTYRVTETVPPGWLATLPAAVDVDGHFQYHRGRDLRQPAPRQPARLQVRGR